MSTSIRIWLPSFKSLNGKLMLRLLSPCFMIFGLVWILTTTFLVWSWTHLNGTNPNPILSEYERRSNYNGSLGIMESTDEGETDHLFKERSESLEKICSALPVVPPFKMIPRRTPVKTEELKLKKIMTPPNSHASRNRRNWIFIKLRPINETRAVTPPTHSFLFRKEDTDPTGKSIWIEWCPVYKAASSPWMAVFGKLIQALTPHTQNLIQKGKLTFIKLFQDLRLNIPFSASDLSGSRPFKMLIVRHPFDRLLSAYRDKIERIEGRDYYYKKYGRKILSRYRASNGFNSSLRDDRKGNRKGIFRPRLGSVLGWKDTSTNKPFTKERPTFPEFVQYLLRSNPNTMDEHWRPIYLECNPCAYSFDWILKVETMGRDRAAIYNALNISNNTKVRIELDQIWDRWSNKAQPSKSSSVTTTNLLGRLRETYFSQVNKSDLKLLYDKYKMDFLLFNYSPKTYFLMGK